MSTVELEAPVRLPRLNEPAPPFEAVTTHGRIRLADFEGSWLILFSHPGDFTPVCTTEFIAFAEAHPRFRELGVEPVGLSIDSVYSHIAWIRNIEQTSGVRVPFPVIADLDRAVANAYGMVMPGESTTETVRSVFVIDPKGILRAIVYYPLTTGRNVEELIRLVTALKTSDEHAVATPANWQAGEKVIVPAPATAEAAEERVGSANGYECVDWYLCRKSL